MFEIEIDLRKKEEKFEQNIEDYNQRIKLKIKINIIYSQIISKKHI